MSEYPAKAIHNFRSGMNCAQSVLSAFSEHTNLGVEQSVRVAAAFGGGMADTQGICGAITGGLMVLGGYFYNPQRPEITGQIVNQYARTFFNLFMEKHKHLNCRDLSGVDFTDEKAKQKAEAEGLYDNCEELIKDSCFIVEEMIKMYPQDQK